MIGVGCMEERLEAKIYQSYERGGDECALSSSTSNESWDEIFFKTKNIIMGLPSNHSLDGNSTSHLKIIPSNLTFTHSRPAAFTIFMFRRMNLTINKIKYLIITIYINNFTLN